MKKQILFFVLTSFLCLTSLAFWIYSTYDMANVFSHLGTNAQYKAQLILPFLFYLSVFTLSCASTIYQGISIKKEFDKSNEKRKSERAAAKQEKAAAEKQKQIAELQAKLDELKKDGE